MQTAEARKAALKTFTVVLLTISSIIAFLMFIGVLVGIARAHSDGGMVYPIECCHQLDCAPVDRSQYIPPAAHAGLFPSGQGLPTLFVVTKHGSAYVSPTLERRESKDHRMHACIRENKVICIFVPPGM